MIVNVSLKQYKWQLELLEETNRKFDVNLVLSDVDNILEHERTVSNPIVLWSITEWIRDRGFLHPILATKYRNQYVIADGTHRTLALRDIKARDDPNPLLIPIMEIQPKDFTRGSWALLFDEGLPDVEQLLDGCWSIEEIRFESEDLMELFDDEQLGVVLKTRGKIFGLYSIVDTRYNFLDSLKKIENRVGIPSRYLIAEDAIGLASDYLIFAPPKDDKKDLSLLVEHPELRRSKASRTIIPVKPMFLPIPLEVLKLPKEEGADQIANIINQSIDNDTIKIATPDLKKFDFCGEIWDEYMIIFNSQLVYRCVSQDVDSQYLNRLRTPEIKRTQ
ncbi:MAG: hypothetical protein ACXACA_03505 [Candidatus Ranarchaeia archaeon]